MLSAKGSWCRHGTMNTVGIPNATRFNQERLWRLCQGPPSEGLFGAVILNMSLADRRQGQTQSASML